MKKLILFFTLFVAYIFTNAQGVWLTQATGFQSPSSGVRNISAVDTSVVWISPYDGTGGGFPRQDYSMTIDGGAHWTAGVTPAPAVWDYSMITGSSATSAWAVYYNASLSPAGQGLLYHTTDGGATWTQQGNGSIYSYPGASFPNIIHFFDDNNGVIIGDPAQGEFEIYTTTDGGTTWTPVPAADIADPELDEAGWTTHISTFGDNVWFDTNHGRVYHSSDKGYHWTVAATNLFIPIPGTIDICFYSATNGIARYFDAATFNSDIVETTDGGATWGSTFNATGSFYGSDVKAVPGTASTLVSTGSILTSSASFAGSSYSSDGGHSWNPIDVNIQHTALDVADSLTMWSGGFNQDATTGGIHKFVVFEQVSCNDPSVSPGTPSASDSVVCDSVTFTSTGVVSPVIGSYSGVSWLVSKTDISGSLDPLNEPSLIASYQIVFPAASVDTRLFVNDLSLIEGLNNPFGTYYWTPVVFGNATTQTPPATFFHELTLDLNCVHVGTSVPVYVWDPSIPDCGVGIAELKTNQFSVNAYIKDQSLLNIQINSLVNGKANIEITDPTGRLVKSMNTKVSIGNNNETINVEDLATGAYILKTDINGHRSSNKILKY